MTTQFIRVQCESEGRATVLGVGMVSLGNRALTYLPGLKAGLLRVKEVAIVQGVVWSTYGAFPGTLTVRSWEDHFAA